MAERRLSVALRAADAADTDQPESLAARWCAWRNRLLAAPGFQRWAARFPLTRLVARRRARRLFDLCAGFVYSQVLYACVRLEVPAALATGPRSTAELARHCDLEPAATERLLGAAAALGLVERLGDGRYVLGADGAVLAGSPAIAAMVAHHDMLYRDLVDPVALLRDATRPTTLERFWGYARATHPAAPAGAEVAGYSALMAASQPLVADEVLDACDLRGCRCLLDVGGGDGAFLAAVGARHAKLELMLFDLPAVVARAAERLAAAGLDARASVHGGDFFSTPLPRGADVVTLVRVLHDHDDAACARLLANLRGALVPGARLIVAEPMAATPGAAPLGAAYFGFYLLAMGSGRARTPRELARLLDTAGFAAPRLAATRQPLQTQVLVAVAR
ncbi:MAG: methyltransferase [Gammaproteobacteria bacterium]